MLSITKPLALEFIDGKRIIYIGLIKISVLSN